jgi:hypothetical protein
MSHDRNIGGSTHAPVVPNDNTVLNAFNWLHIGGAGDVTVTSPTGVDATYKGLPAGSKLDVPGIKVKATGTTATFIVAVYA